MGSRIEEQEQRIARIFGQRKVPMSNQTTLRKYLGFLKRELEQPCQLTGIEDFPWEELVSLNEETNDHYGLLAWVKRLSDKNLSSTTGRSGRY